jgi:hypothetical protein
MEKGTRSRLVSVVAGLAATTLLLGMAACGGGGTTKAQAPQTTVPTVTQPAPAPTTTLPPGVSPGNYQSIHQGMTLADVERLLGPNQTWGTPGGSQVPNETLYIWYAHGAGTEPDISVWFGSTTGLVTSKDQTGLQ